MKINLSEQLEDILLGKKKNNLAVKVIDMEGSVKWFYRNCSDSVSLVYLYINSFYIAVACM